MKGPLKGGAVMFQQLPRAFLAVLVLLLPLTGMAPHHASVHTSAQSITLTEEDYYTADPGKSAIDNLLKEYTQSHPGVRITTNHVSGANLVSKVLQQAAVHTLPDILILGTEVQDFADTGVLADLGPYTRGWSGLRDYYKSSLATGMWKGKLYGITIGSNDLAIYYNVKILKAAGISQPPTTWAELRADAKKLTHGHTYGFAFSAPTTEEGTWQWLPFFWGDGGDLLHVDSTAGIQALSLWTQFVKDGSVSKDVVNWTQGDVASQFIAGNAAMMEMGPWELPALTSTKGLQFGMTYLPVPRKGMPPVSPLGGEVWTLPRSTPDRQQAAWNFLKWTQDTTRLVKLDTALAYLPAYKPANQVVVKRNPLLHVFADELPTARVRTAILGSKYPQASEAIWKALQNALIGSQSPQKALQTAQATINTLGH